MHRSTFLKHIKNLEEEDLRQELKMLYDKVKAVKQFYTMEIGSTKDREKKYTKAKEEITAKFKTKSYRKPRRPRIQKINKIVSELNKISVFNYEMIDVYLFCAETGLKFMREYNFESTPVNNLICKSFQKAILLIDTNRMKDEFEDRCTMILNDANYYWQIKGELENAFQTVYET